MTKVVSYTALLYGADYLGSAIRSVIDHMDEHHIIFSPVGAHGSRTDLPCPDSRDELYAIAEQAAGSKLHWHDSGPFTYEGQQREAIHQYAPDADVIVVLDADEIWPSMLIRNMTDGIDYPFFPRRVRLPVVHFWRSFYRAVIHDPASPVRVIYPKRPEGETGLSDMQGAIAHMGYAQRSELVYFKQFTHGHRGEWRRDCNWYRDKFLANSQEDVHPVGSQYWWPEEINPWDYLPEFMKSHPYANLEVIP